MSLLSSAAARVAVVVSLGVFRPLTEHRERRGAGVLGGRKPITGRAEHGGVGDLVPRQFIGNLIKRRDEAFYQTDDAANRSYAFKLRHIGP